MRKIITYLVLMLVFLLPAGAEEDTYRNYVAESNYIPSVSLDNYWNAFGAPRLDASLTGTDEFERGDAVDLYVELTNYGRIMGFDADKKADTKMEKALSDKEWDYEQERTTTLAIVGTLRSTTDMIEVQSGDQMIESLRSGERAKNPMVFTIKIGKHIPAGEYPMLLDLRYDYQYNAEVDADGWSSDLNRLTGLQVGYWYEKANQTITIPVTVKKEADFVITGVDADLKVGQGGGIVEVAYKNIGEDPTNEAVARLSVFNPFSSSDDQAYIGTLGPDEERTVRFKIDVDDDATPKPYGINSEIKYKDVRGDTVISESMKIPVDVVPAARSYTLLLVVILILLVAAGARIYTKRR